MNVLIEILGKQFKAQKGDKLRVPYINEKIGKKLTFDNILYSDDGKHSINFIGRNLGDEIVIIGGGAIPGRIQRQEGTSSLLQDQTATTTLGRTLTLQYKFRM